MQRDMTMTFQFNSGQSNRWPGNEPLTTASEAGQAGSNHEYFTIGDMARTYDVSLRALRFYEDRGLMKPLRHGYVRLYDVRQRVRLQLILKGKKLGFTLTEIREMLASQGEQEPVEFESTLDPGQIVSQIAHLERQRSGLDNAIQELRATHERLASAGEEAAPAAS